MADFIKLTVIEWDKEGKRQEFDRVLNKFLIKSIEEDRHHDQTFIIYDKDEEIRVKETLAEINAKSAE
jgi:hypothetical protein